MRTKTTILRAVALGLCLLTWIGAPASAQDPAPDVPQEPAVSAAQDAGMRRVLTCVGADATMEIYVPESVVSGRGVENVDVQKPVIGAYTLDLTAAGKGKMLEPVRVSLVDDGTMLQVDQYTRGLPPTRIPVDGGVVDFDNRFGVQAKCPPLNE